MAWVGVQTPSYQPPEDGAVLGCGWARVDHRAWKTPAWGSALGRGIPLWWASPLAHPRDAGGQAEVGSGWYKGYQAPARRLDPRAHGATVPTASLLPDVPGQAPARQDGGHGQSRQTGPGPGQAASVQAGGGEQSHCCPAPGTQWHLPAARGRLAQAGAQGASCAPAPSRCESEVGGAGRPRVRHTRAQGCGGRGPSCAGARVCENVWGLV